MRLLRLKHENDSEAPSRNSRHLEPYQRHDVEEWFLKRGMPAVTRTSSGFRYVLLRAAPVLFGIAVIYLLITLIDVVLRELSPGVYSDPDAALLSWYIFALLASVLMGLVAGLLSNRYVRQRVLSVRQVEAITTIVPLTLLLLPVLDAALGLTSEPWLDASANVALMVVVVILIRVGLGAIFVWSIRHAVAQFMALTSMAARAIPMILLVTLFAFLSDGVWAVTNSLARDQLWNVVLLFLTIAGIFVWVVIRDEMRSMMDGTVSSVEDVLAQRFPADHCHLDSHVVERPFTLTRRESANATALLLIAQAIQIGLLVAVVFAFFCVFGSIAIPPSVVGTWTGHDATAGSLLGVQLPVNNELIQTSLFLAAFSSVSFAASSVTDPVYRKSFFEPLLRDMTVTITARNLYHASRADGSVPTPS